MNSELIKKGIAKPHRVPPYIYNKTRKKIGRKTLTTQFEKNGIHILDADWDTLIILDTCRYDYFRRVNPFDGNLKKKRTLGTVTADFVKRNFENRNAHDVVYLSDNSVVGKAKQRDHLNVYKLVGTWSETSLRSKKGQENIKAIVDPDPVIQKSVQLHEKYPNKRHIVHLLPPHTPHLVKDGNQLSSDSPYRNYDAVRQGYVDRETMRNVYEENLKNVLASVERLIQEIEGKKIITSDHGELLGEDFSRWKKWCSNRWGNDWEKYRWGHYPDIDVSGLTEIPWLELPYETQRQTTSDPPDQDEFDEHSIEEHLEALGYK